MYAERGAGEEGCNTMSFGFVGFGGKWGGIAEDSMLLVG